MSVNSKISRSDYIQGLQGWFVFTMLNLKIFFLIIVLFSWFFLNHCLFKIVKKIINYYPNSFVLSQKYNILIVLIFHKCGAAAGLDVKLIHSKPGIENNANNVIVRHGSKDNACTDYYLLSMWGHSMAKWQIKQQLYKRWVHTLECVSLQRWAEHNLKRSVAFSRENRGHESSQPWC